MPRKPISFELDFMVKDIFPRFTVKQFDDVSFNVTPLVQGEQYDTTNMTAKIFVGVNNDMFMQTTNIIVSSNNINVLLDRNMLQKQGRAYAEIELTDENGTITSSSFIFDIDPKIGEGGIIPGEYEGFVAKYERLIAEFKTQVENAISDSKSRTTSAINTFNTNANNTISSFNSNSTNALNTFNANANNKLTDVEKRFQKLTAEQQQDAEVIDARDGEVSLKARLERDLAKGKIIEQDVEGSYITVSDSVEGNITNIEILGNTVQNATNLADIKSVGIKNTDGTYEMSILSCGKNLFNGKLIDADIGTDLGEVRPSTGHAIPSEYIKCPSNTVLTMTYTPIVSPKWVVFFEYDNNKKLIKTTKSKSITTTQNTVYVKFKIEGSKNIGIKDLMIQEGTQSTSYEPYQENKCDILLPCQLGKGDRLYHDDVEKAWCILKGEVSPVYDGNSGWSISFVDTNTVRVQGNMVIDIKDPSNTTVKCISDKFKSNTSDNVWNIDEEGISVSVSSKIVFRISKTKATTLEEIKKYLNNNPFMLKYITNNPQKIILPLDVQIQLNSFFGTTHMWLESGEVEGTIKATVPKSLGASVQSLSTKTDILSNRVEAIEGLKDSQNMTYTTDKGYLVAEATQNGVVKDLKVSGKTLVNRFKFTSTTVSSDKLYIKNTNASLCSNGEYTIVNNTNKKIGYDIGVLSTDTYLKSGVINPNSSITVNVGVDEYIRAIKGAFSDGWSEGEKSILEKSTIVLSGNYGDNFIVSYFEGLKSVGQDVDVIEVSTRKEDGNLFDGEYKKGNIDDSTGLETSSTSHTISKDFCMCEGNCFYNIESSNTTSTYAIIYQYDNNKNFISKTSFAPNALRNITTDSRCKYFKVKFEGIQELDFSLYKNTNSDYQSHKKQLLYYNELGELKSIPQLREWDSVEEKGDKTIVTIGSKEIVLDGSEGQDIRLTTSNGGFTRFALLDKNIKINSIGICDKLKSINPTGTFTEEGFYCGSDGSIQIVISNDKAGTLEAFKTFVSQNPYTFVTQLAEPKIYECPNINLSSYSNETMISLNSGAINPHMEFSITSHINELVKNNQSRINELESYVHKVATTILSEGYQGLAYLLYPNDFIEENEIELLPVEPI